MSNALGIKLVEAYLLIVGVVHALTAMLLTYPKRKYIAKSLWQRGKLAISGTILLIFIVLHLLYFRFGKGEEEGYMTPADAGGVKMRDLYRLDVELFAGPSGTRQLAFYMLALGAVAVHLFSGWTKAVLKMDATKEQRPKFVAMGHALIWPLVIGFAIGPLYVWAAQRPGVLTLPAAWQIAAPSMSHDEL
jgi:succinate dehydrogenase/fumarate reductase cytochrome b subunit